MGPVGRDMGRFNGRLSIGPVFVGAPRSASFGFQNGRAYAIPGGERIGQADPAPMDPSRRLRFGGFSASFCGTARRLGRPPHTRGQAMAGEYRTKAPDDGWIRKLSSDRSEMESRPGIRLSMPKSYYARAACESVREIPDDSTGGPVALQRRPGRGDAGIQAFLAQAPQ